MDLSKYPFEKIFFFIAGVIPGFVALLIFHLASPGAFQWFFMMGFLGYKSKLSIIILTAFVVGNSMTAFLNGLLGALGGAIGGWKGAADPYVPPHTYAVAPWRDPRWRIALAKHLGVNTPKDTRLLTDEVVKLRREMVDALPDGERPVARANIDLEKVSAEIDDSAWAQWYDHYHQIVLLDERKLDVDVRVGRGLYFNLETAAVYVLISAFWIRTVRHWWCILPACMWVLLLAAKTYSDMSNVMNKWSSLSDQIKYLYDNIDAIVTSE